MAEGYSRPPFFPVTRQLDPHQRIIVSYMMGRGPDSRGNEEMSATAYGGAAILLLVGAIFAEGAPAAGSTCEAFGRTYRDGESFTLSTGEYGYPRTYICTGGTWRDYDGTLCQLRPGRGCMPVANPTA